jgi:hypothetical protein
MSREAANEEIVNYSPQQLGTMVEKIAGDDAMMAWIDKANDAEDEFPEEEDDVSWDVGTE